MTTQQRTTTLAKSLSVVLASWGLFGCATSMKSVDSEYVPTDSALVVYSTRVKDSCGGTLVSLRLDYDYQLNGKQQTGMMMLKNPFFASDFKDHEGFFIIDEWPASDYTFTRLTLSGTKVGMASTHAYGIKTKLEAGKIYYLGEFHADLPSCQSVILSLKDEHQRDAALFDSRMNKLSSSTFVRDALPLITWKPNR